MKKVQAVLLSLCVSGWAIAQSEPKQPLPNLWVAEKLEWDGKAIQVGMSRQEVAAVLGSGMKIIQKPKPYTREKLLSERDWAIRLMPHEAPAFGYFDVLAENCESCWIELLGRKLSKREEIRIPLTGSTVQDLRVATIIIDRGHARYRIGRAVSDAVSGTRYVITDDGIYRISQFGRVTRIETLK